MTVRLSNPWLVLAMAVVVVVALDPSLALAKEAGGQSMPWDTPLKKIGDALTGPVAYWFTLFGIFVSGGVLIFGGEINQFVRSIAMVVLVGAVMTGATTVMKTLFTEAAIATEAAADVPAKGGA
jgi:type IV secretion system protein TrbC